MRRGFVFSVAVLLAGVASAQAPVRTPAYDLLIVRDTPPPDPAAAETLSALRQAAAAKDEGRLAGLLAPDFTALSCSADPTTACAPGKGPARVTKPPIERLRLALCCGGRDDPAVPPRDRNEAMFGVLASLLEGGTAAGDAGEVCQPALPRFDRRKLAALAKRVDVDASTMRIAAAPIEARPRPDRTATVAATIPKGTIVPLLTTSATPAPAGWTVLALPSGGLGYAEGVSLDEIAPEAACVRRTKDGWRLAVVIGRQS